MDNYLHSYPITIHHIFLSRGHNYFGRPKEGLGTHLTEDVASVEAVAGQGLVGDRYFGVAAHYDAQVTFVAWEVFRALREEFGREDWSPVLMRRNIVVEGIPLLQLIGRPFTIDLGGHAVEFVGARHCAPCAWMDAVLAPGAQKFLRGRGGLRARIVGGGEIQKGAAALIAGAPLDMETILEPLKPVPLP